MVKYQIVKCEEATRISERVVPLILEVCLSLFYTIATIFQLYHDVVMMYEMRRESLILHFY